MVAKAEYVGRGEDGGKRDGAGTANILGAAAVQQLREGVYRGGRRDEAVHPLTEIATAAEKINCCSRVGH
jgi:hypothetical protein